MPEQTEKNTEPKRLYRSVVDRMICGICGGFAEYFDVDSTLIRIVWLIFIFIGGFGILAYLACLIVMKENPYQNITDKKKHQNTGLIIGVVLILLGLAFFSSNLNWGYFYFRPYRWHLFRPWFVGWDRFWPLIIILFGVLYIYHVLRKEKKQQADNSFPETSTIGRRFTRSRNEKMIGGVCGGMAEYLNIDPVLMRILWILITLFSGVIFGVIFYIILLIIIPEESSANELNTEIKKVSSKTTSRKTKSSNQNKKE